ncbi:MAG TPA: LCP family protein [Streptosporangiaceae bacterium]|nr:LCP family protein [Streptosporangiaceae bacterium]
MNRYHDLEGTDDGHPAPGPRMGSPADPGPQRSRWSFLGPHPVLGAAAIISTVLVVGVSLVAYAAVRNVYDGINHEDVTAQMLGNRPPKLNGSTNILLIGSDSRAGTDGKFGKDVLGARSDTTMVLHITPDHTHAYVISFPRDSMVPVYGCDPDQQGHPGQSAAPGELEPLNATFSAGGAPCLWKTLEQTTRIRIDHFVEVGFDSFESIVNDVGGINVCLPFAIRNTQAHLYLSAGRHLVHGAQALAFVRLRENIGDGSDLQRIQRQQIFLASAMQKIEKTNLLGDYKVIKDAADAVTTDLSLTQMLGIANSMKGLSSKSVRFISVPVVPYPLDIERVQWEMPQADTLFSAIAHDTHILKAVKAAKGKATPAPTVSPSKVQLEVLNGSGTMGIASTAATGLSNLGFSVIGTGDAPNFTYTDSVIEYSSAAQLPEVNTLKKEVTGVQVKQVGSLQAGTLSLILGSKFTGLASGQAAKGPSVATLNSDNFQGISANQNICNDAAAFEGPDSPVPTSG